MLDKLSRMYVGNVNKLKGHLIMLGGHVKNLKN